MTIELGLHNTHNSTRCESAGRQRANRGWEAVWSGLSEWARRPVVERFWSRIDRSGECLVCVLSAGDAYGHAQFTFSIGVKQYHCYAHRFAWVLKYGAIPGGLFILHRCDNGPCVRDEHLFLGDQDDNMKDAARKGRLRPNLKGLYRHSVELSVNVS